MARLSFSFIVVPLLFVLASATFEDVQFSYSGPLGPAKWGAINPTFSSCSSGKSQSPINIVPDGSVLNKSLSPLTRDYKPGNATLVNSGDNIRIKFEEESGTLVTDGGNYTLKEMVWHTPSEHQIDGQTLDAELHLVHKSASGNTAIVAILYKYGNPDPFITKIQTKLVELANEKCSEEEEAHISLGAVDIKLLRKNTRKYYRYVGSLTAPPCTENVTWNILGKVRTISRKQVDTLRAPLDDVNKNNSRPVQPLNGRKVELYIESDS